MKELILLCAAIALCVVIEGITSALRDIEDDESAEDYAECMDDVAEDIKRDVKRIKDEARNV